MLIWLQTLPMFKCAVSSGSSKVNYCFQIQYTGYWKIKSTLSSEIYFLHIKLSPILPFPSSKNGKIIIEVWNPSSTHSIDTKCFLLLHMHMMQRGNLKVLTDKFNLQSCLCHSKPVIYSPYVAETLWSECLCIGIWTKSFIGKLRQQLRGKEFDHYHRSLGLVRAPMMCDSEIGVCSVLFQVYFASGRSCMCFSPECLFYCCTLTTCSISCSTLD